ncbi:MAG: twin-arginine translocase subunit TatC [Solirubrobacteraceae bacterium]|nr:MAG: twin-arginine translocase subunit TatC [Solirubrobacterales bacterium]
MATAIRTIRPVGHEDRLTLVEHLDELRTRLIISLIAIAVAFAFCFWQNHAIIKIVNKPLEQQTISSAKNNSGSGGLQQLQSLQVSEAGTLRAVADSNGQTAAALDRLAATSHDAAARAELRQAASVSRSAQLSLTRYAATLPKHVSGKEPITLGVGEPLTETIKVTGYAAILLALPFVLWQLYGFVLPAFSPSERRVAFPLMCTVPLLFACGVAFGYFVVLPPAIHFLQGFNNQNFDVLVQARQYYSFELLVLLGLGVFFQVPIGILAVTRMGIVTPRQLKKNRRYALLVIAVLVAILPVDPITMIISMVPLLALYEGSIQFAALVDRRAQRRERAAGPDIDENP